MYLSQVRQRGTESAVDGIKGEETEIADFDVDYRRELF